MCGFRLPAFPGLLGVSSDDIDMEDEDWDVMRQSAHENPSENAEFPWCQYVRRLKEISKPNLIGLFHASCPLGHVTLEMCMDIQMALATLC